MLTNLTSTLTKVQKVLQQFSKVSYYKVNATKSYILDLGVDATTRNLLQTYYPYTWVENDIPYLGVQLTKSTKNLFTYNFKPFLTNLQKEIQHLAKYELSWSGRLAAFKMIHLLQLLYLFRTIPIPIAPSYFKALQTMLNKFLWQGKKPRCAHSKLFKHKLAGGPGSINFEDYQWTSILT